MPPRQIAQEPPTPPAPPVMWVAVPGRRVRELVTRTAISGAVHLLRLAKRVAPPPVDVRPVLRSADLPCRCHHRQDSHTAPRDGHLRTCIICDCRGFQLDTRTADTQDMERRLRAHPAVTSPGQGRRRGRLSVVPDGYAQGRADLQLNHTPPTVIPREEWEADGLEATIARHAAEEHREGDQHP